MDTSIFTDQFFRLREESLQLIDKLVAAGDMGALLRLAEQEEGHIAALQRRLGEIMNIATAEEYRRLLLRLRQCNPLELILFQTEEWGTVIIRPPWHPLLQCGGFHVTGTLPFLAVALQRTDMLEMLLDMGFSPQPRCNPFYPVPKDSTLLPIFGNTSRADYPHRGSPEHPLFWDLSPLALAILLGQSDAAALLLRHGADTEANSGAVSWAMHLGFRQDDPAYRRARETVLAHGDPASHRPRLAALTRSNLDQLREVLKTYRYDARDCCSALLADFHYSWEEYCQCALLLSEHCPALREDPHFLEALFRHGCIEQDMTPLLPLFPEETLDLTQVDWDGLPVRGMEQILSFLAVHRHLTAEATEIEGFASDPRKQISLLMKHVHLSYDESRRKEQICPLTWDALKSDSPRLLRRMLQQGIIRESTKDILLTLQEYFPMSLDLYREALLTTKRDPALVWADWQKNEKEEFYGIQHVGETVGSRGGGAYRVHAAGG